MCHGVSIGKICPFAVCNVALENFLGRTGGGTSRIVKKATAVGRRSYCGTDYQVAPNDHHLGGARSDRRRLRGGSGGSAYCG
jgi:hypothetical protein